MIVHDKILVFLILLLAGLFLSLTCCGCEATIEEGYKDGTVYSLSRQGLHVKSWEGTLVLPKPLERPFHHEYVFWHFSVDDNVIVDDLFRFDLRPVRIYYRKVLWNALLFHETPYRITRVIRLPVD
jgi:hypothetical protein